VRIIDAVIQLNDNFHMWQVISGVVVEFILDFFHVSSLNTKVKELLKLVRCCQSCHKKQKWYFLSTVC